MKVYGITGGAGTGKSEVMKLLRERFGACVILSDDVARELMMPGHISYDLVTACFGRDLLNDDLTIDRKRLADKVFHNPEALAKLNEMTHPYVREEIQRQIREAKASGKYSCVALESAILLDCGYEDICDEFWYIHTDVEIRRERMKSTRGYSDEKVDAVLRNQPDEESFYKKCDFVIVNNSTIEDVYEQLKKKLG